MVKYATTEEKRSKAMKPSCRVMNIAAELCTFSSLTVEVLPREHCCAGLAADQLHIICTVISLHMYLWVRVANLVRALNQGKQVGVRATSRLVTERWMGLTSKGPGVMGTKGNTKSTDQGLSYYLKQTQAFSFKQGNTCKAPL